LKENLYNLLSNLLTDEQLRKQLGNNVPLLEALCNRINRFVTNKDLKFVKPAEALLGTFVNL